MSHSTIIVNYGSGQPAANKKVVLSFDYGGVTSGDFTDKYGEVNISHSATGKCKIIVAGSTVRSGWHAPGTTSVTI